MKTINNEAEYKEYKKRYEAKTGNNEETSVIEVWEFLNNIPKKYFSYIDEDKQEMITWTGQKLGDVSFGKEYRDNFGGRRVPISVKGINGKSYYGTYYKSSGNYCNIKLYKKNA